jgi:rubredoxin
LRGPFSLTRCARCTYRRSYIYSNAKAFDAQPSSYKCPVCKAPKAAFVEKDTAGVNALIPIVAALVLAAAGAGVYLSKL